MFYNPSCHGMPSVGTGSNYEYEPQSQRGTLSVMGMGSPFLSATPLPPQVALASRGSFCAGQTCVLESPPWQTCISSSNAHPPVCLVNNPPGFSTSQFPSRKADMIAYTIWDLGECPVASTPAAGQQAVPSHDCAIVPAPGTHLPSCPPTPGLMAYLPQPR